jgi:hypothetical protein
VIRSTFLVALIFAVCAACCPDGTARQSYSWADVKDKPWQKLPELTRDDLVARTGFSELQIVDKRTHFALVPGTKNAFGPVHEYHPTDKGNWAVYGPDYRSYVPYVVENAEQDVGINNYLNLRGNLPNLPQGEMFCMLRYGTAEKTNGLSFPRDLLFVRKRYMDDIDKHIQPGPRYLARLLNQPKLADSIVGWCRGMGENLVVIDTCLGTAPRYDDVETNQWVRRYQSDPEPKHLDKERKWVGETDAKDDVIGDYKIREFSDGKFYLKKIMIGKKEFWYVDSDLDLLKKNWPFVEKIGDLKASDLQTEGWAPYLEITHNCEKLNELIKDDETVGEITARWVDFLGSCKYYWADTWGWNPLDYMLDSERFDCDSAGKMVMASLRLKGIPASVAFQPSHGWCECYLPGTGFAMGIDMTAGNSKIFRQTDELLAYQFDKGVLDTPQVVEDCAIDDAHTETGNGPSEWGTVFMQSDPDWYMIGPFDYPDEKSYDLVYPPEKEQIIGKSYPGKGGVTCTWQRPFEGEKHGCPRFDMVDSLAKVEWYIAYALGYYYSPRKQDGQMRIGTDDTGKVWLNDKLIYTCKIHRGVSVDDDIVPITLEEGWNKFLIKIGQGVGGAGFMVRFTDADANSLPGLKFTCEPWGIDPGYASIYITQPTEFVPVEGKQKVVVEVLRGNVEKAEARFCAAGFEGLAYVQLTKGDDGKFTGEIDAAGCPGEGAAIEVRAWGADGRMTVAAKPMHLMETGGCMVDGEGFIRDWLLLGPYTNEKDSPAFDVEYVEPEKVEFIVGEPAEKGAGGSDVVAADGQSEGANPRGQPIELQSGGVGEGAAPLDGGMAWKSMPPNKYANLVSYRLPYVNFVSMFDKNEWVFTYAGTYVYSPEQQAVKLCVGSDDQVKAWLNGKSVMANDVARGAAKDQDMVSVTLNKGWNKLLVKVCQGYGGWGMYVRFTDAAGQPIRNLRISPEKPEQ